MKNKFPIKNYLRIFHLYFIIKLSLCLNNKNYLENFHKENTTRIPYIKNLLEIIKNYSLYSISKAHYNVTNECKTLLINNFNDSSNLYLYKLYKDSSHRITEIGSYYNCKNSIYYSPTEKNKSTENLQLTYILFYIPKFQNQRSYLFGGCFPKGCKGKEYFYILQSFNEYTEIINSDDLERIEIYETDIKNKLNIKFFVGLSALIIMFLIISFIIFNDIPVLLFKCCCCCCCCCKKKNFKYNFHSLEMLKDSFNLSENIIELMPIDDKNIHSRIINNDDGIVFIKGLRGIIILSYIFGNTMKSLYLFPVQENEIIHFNTFSYSFLFFLLRFSRNMLISISGFLLSYKLLCFFDKEMEKMDIEEDDYLKNSNPIEIEKQFNNEFNDNQINKKKNDILEEDSNDIIFHNDLNEEPFLSNIIENQKNSIPQLPMNIFTTDHFESNISLYNKIPLFVYFKFFGRHIYKYILFILFLLILKCAYYDIISYLFHKGPLWNFLKQSIIDNEKFRHLLGNLLFFYPFIPSLNNLYYNSNDLVILEFSFFIIFSFILFIGFKKNYRLDKFIIFSLIFQIIIKLGIYLFIWFIYIGKNIYIVNTGKFYPSKDFLTKDWNFIRNNQFYNFGSYIIGIFFGFVNYIIQKSIRNENVLKHKKYLTIPLIYVKYLERYPTLTILIFSFVFIISFLLFGLSYLILFKILIGKISDPYANRFYTNFYINIFYLFDVDAFIIIIYLSLIPYILLGENFIISTLKIEYWNILSRPYFTFTLVMPVLIINLLYQIETKFTFKINTIIMYSFNNLIFGISICAIIYLCFEIPLKKVNHLLFISKKNESYKIDDDDNE